jgi:formate hydrogenlyase subunit 3/multisubunit Na+/H+ antiporter MnhD subunit
MLIPSHMHQYFLSLWLVIGLAAILWPAWKVRNWKQVTCSAASIILATCAYALLLSDDFSMLPYCFGAFVLGGWILMRKFGAFDPSFAAKKLLSYYLTAIFLFFCAECCVSHLRFGTLLILVAFCILGASYPFHGWIEHFFVHAPSCLVSAFLLFFRPAVWFFTLQFLSTFIPVGDHRFLRIFCMILGIWSCFFVPVLFFSKKENRKLLGYMVCWQNGIIWLMLSYCKVYNYVFLFEFSLIQSISLALLFLCFIETQRQLNGDDTIGIRATYRFSKLRTYIIFATLASFKLWPLLICYLVHTSYFCATYCAISCALYLCFVLRTFILNFIGI